MGVRETAKIKADMRFGKLFSVNRVHRYRFIEFFFVIWWRACRRLDSFFNEYCIGYNWQWE